MVKKTAKKKQQKPDPSPSNRIGDRIGMVIKALEMNPNSFGKACGIMPQSLNSILKDPNLKPNYTTLFKILERYPALSSEWLMRDEGEMFRKLTPDEKLKEEYATIKGELKSIELALNERAERIEDLGKAIELFKSTISDKQLIIDLLQKEKRAK